MKESRHPLVIGCVAGGLGAAAALFYAREGLAISHFDARAHLVVARRILDSLCPGWQQIGAVWLPLPHVLNMLPVQVDSWYRSGASAVAISVASSAVSAWAVARLIAATTGSIVGGAVAAALLLANPNLLYIQSTPMTEPLLLATGFASLALLAGWVQADAPGWPHAPGLALTAACMTRYEGWLIAAAAIALTFAVLLRQGRDRRFATEAALRLTVYPAAAILLFCVNSRWTIGTWFIPSGFFVPENEALGRPWLAFTQVRDSIAQLSGRPYIWGGYAGIALTLVAFARSRSRAPLILLLAILAAAALPGYAYLHGHPLRVRYGLIPVAACAALTGAAVAMVWRPLRAIAAVAIVGAALWGTSPIDRSALLIGESRRDDANAAGRRAITTYLVAHYRHESPIMLSMGSLAHYMHDLGRVGFDIHSFLHEGNGQAWQYAVLAPGDYVSWLVLEERAEGGDALFQARERDPRYLEAFDRVAEGGGAALYRRRQSLVSGR